MGIQPEAYEQLLRSVLVKRLAVAGAIATRELKEVLSVPAPVRVSKKTGRRYAIERATPGAPPRKVTGFLRASVTFLVDAGKLVCRVGTNVDYGKYLEEGNHPWLEKTMAALNEQVRRILTTGRP